MLDTLARGNEEVFTRYLLYPFSQVLMMGVKAKQRDLIKIADYILDFGPTGGIKGGKIMAKGTPEEVAANDKSVTGSYLAPYLKKKKGRKK